MDPRHREVPQKYRGHMSGINQLGYLQFEVSDLDAWEKFATNVLGVMVVDKNDNGFALRWDGHARRIFITEGPADDLAAVGLEMDDDAACAALGDRLQSAGVELVEESAEAAQARGVQKLYSFVEPGGMRFEVYVGPELTDEPLVHPLVHAGFKADDLGLGHMVLRANDLKGTTDFFINVVGFTLSDHIICDLGGYKVNIAFTHMNPRHHSVAFGAGLPKHIHHFLVEVRSLDDVGLAFDRCFDNGTLGNAVHRPTPQRQDGLVLRADSFGL